LIASIPPAAPFIQIAYTPSSGGTGAVLTDDTGTAGTLPTMSFQRYTDT
jgi:hypothetical protein